MIDDDDEGHAAASYWDRTIGPFYTADSVKILLHITDEQLATLIEERDLLAVTTQDGETVYPSFQFGEDRTLLPHLREAFALFERLHVNSWWIALQLNHRTKVWGNRTAAELLQTDQAAEVLLQLVDGRVPLDQRAENEKNLERARPIVQRIAELVGALPVIVHPDTLYVTTRARKPLGVFAVSFDDLKPGLKVLSFSLDAAPDTTASGIADQIRAAVAARRSNDSDN